MTSPPNFLPPQTEQIWQIKFPINSYTRSYGLRRLVVAMTDLGQRALWSSPGQSLQSR